MRVTRFVIGPFFRRWPSTVESYRRERGDELYLDIDRYSVGAVGEDAEYGDRAMYLRGFVAAWSCLAVVATLAINLGFVVRLAFGKPGLDVWIGVFAGLAGACVIWPNLTFAWCRFLLWRAQGGASENDHATDERSRRLMRRALPGDRLLWLQAATGALITGAAIPALLSS